MKNLIPNKCMKNHELSGWPRNLTLSWPLEASLQNTISFWRSSSSKISFFQISDLIPVLSLYFPRKLQRQNFAKLSVAIE
ncbi:Uncharacterized protein HZ326_23260 [Fusarium oxysporum f. sp. albedinis]|nr:Uncharacterized protein HZ326_23260 [Fusarium oxysporum f. sp. albedinis]